MAVLVSGIRMAAEAAPARAAPAMPLRNTYESVKPYTARQERPKTKKRSSCSCAPVRLSNGSLKPSIA